MQTQTTSSTPLPPLRRRPVLSCPTCQVVLRGEADTCRRCGQLLAPLKERVVEIVREVRTPVKVAERMVLVSFDPDTPLKTLDQVRREYVREAMRRCEGNATRAALLLGVAKNTMYRMVREMGRSGKLCPVGRGKRRE